MRTTRPTVTFKAFDVVAVPFPFSDRNKAKKRPALVLSSTRKFNDLIGQSVLAMITTVKASTWPNDVAISDLKHAGLSASSVVRFKLFTLDHRLILNKIGSLAEQDRKAVVVSLREILADIH